MKVRKGHSFDRVSLRTAVREHLTAQINYDPKSTIKDVLKYFSKSDLAAELSETRDKRSKQYKAALRNVERWTTGGKEKRTPGRIYQKRLVSLLRSQDEVLKNQAARTEDITVKVTADITISNDARRRTIEVDLESDEGAAFLGAAIDYPVEAYGILFEAYGVRGAFVSNAEITIE